MPHSARFGLWRLHHYFVIGGTLFVAKLYIIQVCSLTRALGLIKLQYNGRYERQTGNNINCTIEFFTEIAWSPSKIQTQSLINENNMKCLFLC